MESFEKRQRERRNAQKRIDKLARRKERSEAKRERALHPDANALPTGVPADESADSSPEGGGRLAPDFRLAEPKS